MKPSSQIIHRVLFYGAASLIALLLAAIAIPNFVKARWTGSARFIFDVRVLDDATGEPVAGAGVIVYHDDSWQISAKAADRNSATTDAGGRCQVETYFRGSGSGSQSRLSVGKTVFVRAVGYEHWERPCRSILGDFVDIQTGPDVPGHHALEIRLRKPATQL